MAPSPYVGASFTATATAPAQTLMTASLAPVQTLAATQSDDGTARVSWAVLDRPDVPPDYEVERHVGDTAETITPTIEDDGETAGFEDDLTIPAMIGDRTVTEVSVGSTSACAIADGYAYCWGSNTYGQLGDGTTVSSSAPVAVDTSGVLRGKVVTDIAVGSASACAVADGAAYCWGAGGSGRLGNGGSTNSNVPVAVDTTGVLDGKSVTVVSVGTQSSCVVADGAAFCWGNDSASYGLLGSGRPVWWSKVFVPVDASGALAGRTVTDVSVGGTSACAVAAGAAYCWGTPMKVRNLSPVAVVDTSGALSGRIITGVAVGGDSRGDSVCVTTSDGAVFCWGGNGAGQLGDGTTEDREEPATVDASGVLSGAVVTQLAMSSDASGAVAACAVADATIACWGDNTSGRLGDGTTASHSTVPVPVDTSSARLGHYCAPGWALVDEATRCAPIMPVSYRIGYAKAGWQAPTVDVTLESTP